MEFNFVEEGKLYVFEGPDGVGKSTLVDKVSQILSNNNIPNKVFSSPGKENKSLGSLVYKIHHENHSIPYESIQTLHIAAHIEAIQKFIKPAILDGITVLMDRSWLSTYVYGIFHGVEPDFLMKLIEAEKFIWKNVTPELIFLILSDKPKKEVNYNQKDWEKLTALYEMALNKFRFKQVIKFNNVNISSTITSILKSIKHSKALNKKSGLVYVSLSPVTPTKAFNTYWYFAAERQKIFFNRVDMKPFPWTEDYILQKYKFTNTYRASDRVSQFLIKHVIYNGDQSPEEVFFRIMLFKIFNKIETWVYLKSSLGEITFKNYNFELYNKLLNELSLRNPIYSSAYIMPSGNSSFGFSRKHSNHLKLLELMMHDQVPYKIQYFKKMEEVFNLLLTYPTIGKFLAYQYSIDINYSNLTNFSEMEFVFPGPGALDGIKKCFKKLGGLHEIDIIKLMTDIQEQEFKKREIEFKSLWGRPLQLIDCQNLFCEVDKYCRVAHPTIQGISGRKRIKHKFTPNLESINYWYPPKWNINKFISESHQ